jgi:16S rRNA (cytidine1402-2'-O)-methyltransferase
MALIYLIPSQLSDDGINAIHPYTLDVIKKCNVFFVEEQRTARRFLKSLWKHYAPGENIIIDNFNWQDLDNKHDSIGAFKKNLKEDKIIGIISEAGCPGVADPGQQYVAIAQELDVPVIPLVGPSSILLALMASGMNGQQFYFRGYLPIDTTERNKLIREIEMHSHKNKCTQVFIETPYRNNQLLEAILKHCQGSTRLCIAVDITGKQESIITNSVNEWKKHIPELHKRPAIFLLLAE